MVTQVHAALAAEVVHDNPNSHRESNPMVGPPIVAKVLEFRRRRREGPAFRKV